MERELYHPGLRGVVAGETDICSLDGGLRYRGYCIYDLVQGASFLETAFLLLHEQLPNEERFADFVGVIADESSLPAELPHILQMLPLHVSPLEALRSGINLLAHCDPQPGDSPLEAGLAQLTYLVLFSYAFFFKGFSGLAVTIGSIITLFIVMQLTARIRWSETFAKKSAVQAHAG